VIRKIRDGMRHAKTRLRPLRGDQRGVTAVEYGVIAALVLVVCVAAIGTLGSNVYSLLFSNIADATRGASSR